MEVRSDLLHLDPGRKEGAEAFCRQVMMEEPVLSKQQQRIREEKAGGQRRRGEGMEGAGGDKR